MNNNKVAIITDTHYGIRGDSHVFYDYFKQSNDLFFKTIDEQEIKTVFHLGDLFDRRKYINYLTALHCREDFLQPLEARRLDVHILVGNHDTPFKNTNKVNSLNEMLRGYDHIKTYADPTEVKIYNNDILLLPWICDDNYHQTIKMINDSKSPICFGHLSINGYEQYKGQIRDGKELSDLNDAQLSKFDIVASGHFHHKSTAGNIYYLGAPYEFIWSDYNDDRGFHIFDLDTREFTFYKNPHKKFHMIIYDDVKEADKMQNLVQNENFSELSDAYVKLLVLNKDNPYLFDLFIDKIYKASPIDITIVEELQNLNEGNEIEMSEIEDTITLINKYINNLQFNLDSDKMKHMMRKVYNEALIMDEG